MQLEFIYEDESILAVNKPPGLRVIQDGYDPTLPCLSAILQETHQKIWIVHRLDRETSGIVLFAKNSSSHKILNEQFRMRSVNKTYHAIVAGTPTWTSITINSPLKINGDRSHRTVVAHSGGKPAVTHVKVMEVFSRSALLCISPRTGYTHQIRAHLSSIGYPILNDCLYGRRKCHDDVDQILISRLALHASVIEFNHPDKGEQMTLKAGYPQDMASCLIALKTQAGDS